MDGNRGRVESINRSSGGVPKAPVLEARITFGGLEGDRQSHPGPHGGPERAVCLYSRERIEALRGEGHPIEVGLTGENLTLSGVDWGRIVPGTQIEVGEALLEITRFASPCGNIAAAFHDGDVSRISEDLNPGWSRVCARVLHEGLVPTGDPVLVRTALGHPIDSPAGQG
jgi:MOSC domain-containing protein YiiM